MSADTKAAQSGASPGGTVAGDGGQEQQQEKGVWKRSEATFESKRSSEFFDPCQDLANRSIKCMHRNGGDKDMCQEYFQAYRECKKEWIAQRRLAKGSWFS